MNKILFSRTRAHESIDLSLSKGGPPLLRFYLYWAALNAIKKEGPLKAFYTRLVDKGKPKPKAVIAGIDVFINKAQYVNLI